MNEPQPEGSRPSLRHDVLDDPILHLQALHVLARPMSRMKLTSGTKALAPPKVSHGLDLAGVGLERLRCEDALTVPTRGGHVADGAAPGQMVS